MANVELVRLPDRPSREQIVRVLNTVVDSLLGNDGARVQLLGHDGTSTDPNLGTVTGTGLYQVVIRSAGPTHLQVRNSANTTDMLTVTDAVANVQALTVQTTSAFTGGAVFNADVTIGDAAADILTVNATGTYNGPQSFKGNVTLGDAAADTLTVNATGTYVAPQSFNGNVTIGDAAADTLTVNATATFNSPVTFAGALTFSSTVTFNAAATFQALATFNAGATFAAGQTVTGNGTVQFKTPLSAAATVALALTTTPTNITGASLSLPPGIWLVTGVFSLNCAGAGDAGSALVGQLVTSGGTATIANSTSVALLITPTIATTVNVFQAWLVTVTATTTANLQAYKNAGTGASTCGITHTTITASNA